MKWAVMDVWDCAIVYLDAADSGTVNHPEAVLFPTIEEAAEAMNRTGFLEIEEVLDEAEFRSRPPTW